MKVECRIINHYTKINDDGLKKVGRLVQLINSSATESALNGDDDDDFMADSREHVRRSVDDGSEHLLVLS